MLLNYEPVNAPCSRPGIRPLALWVAGGIVVAGLVGGAFDLGYSRGMLAREEQCTAAVEQVRAQAAGNLKFQLSEERPARSAGR